MNLSDALPLIQSIAPESLAESWDPVGLHVGGQDWSVSKALLTIDLTDAVIDEAAASHCDLVISYHPPIFKGLERLTDQAWGSGRILKAAQRGVAVYSPHTALDAAEGGVCDWLCDGLVGEAPASRRPIHPHTIKATNYKLVVFVPQDDEDNVRQAMSQAGAGWIGHYRECSFSAPGTGGFRPIQGANPAIGQVGRRETVSEVRLEMIVPGRYLAAVVAALRAAHPYEEPALDIFGLEPEPIDATQGAGRLLAFDTPQPVAVLAARVKELLGVPACRVTGPERAVSAVAVCPGAGGSLFEGVEADLYFTGEMRHHDVLDYEQRGKSVLLAGHTHTERPYLPIYAARLNAAVDGVAFDVSQSDACPWSVI